MLYAAAFFAFFLFAASTLAQDLEFKFKTPAANRAVREYQKEDKKNQQIFKKAQAKLESQFKRAKNKSRLQLIAALRSVHEETENDGNDDDAEEISLAINLLKEGGDLEQIAAHLNKNEPRISTRSTGGDKNAAYTQVPGTITWTQIQNSDIDKKTETNERHVLQ